MQLTYKSLHVARSIIASSFTETSLICIDSTPIIYTFSLQGEYEKHVNLKSFESYPYRYGHSIALSDHGEYALLADSDNHKVLLVNLEKNKVISHLKCTTQPDFCMFSHDTRYFVIANSIGRLSVYNIETMEIVFESPFADGISTVSFTDNGINLVVATLDKKVYLYNFHTKQLIKKFSVDAIVEAFSFSENSNQIVLFTRMGNTSVINIAMNHTFKADSFSEWPTISAYRPHGQIVLLGTRSSSLFIYTASNGVQLGSIALNNWGITSISLTDTNVFIGFSDGTGMILDMQTEIELAIKALESKNYAQLSMIAAESPLIFINNTLCKSIETHYEAIFAYSPASSEEKRGFEALVSIILSNDSKRVNLLTSLYTSDKIVPFMEHISNGEVEKACYTAHESPLLRQLREFKELRTNCCSYLIKELRLLENDPDTFKTYIDSISQDVSRCAHCAHSFLPTPESLEEGYKQLTSSLSANNFAVITEITERYPILRQTRLYRRMMNYGEALIDKTLMMLSSGNILEADKYAANLSRIKPFALTGQDFKNQIKSYETFINACQNKNLQQIFSIATENPALRTTNEFKQQLLQYRNMIQTPALALAYKGEVTQVISLIAPYSTITYFEEKNMVLLKTALICEIEHYAPFTEEQQLLESYHNCFGWDEHYERVCILFGIVPNTTQTLSEITAECKSKTTFLTGDRKLRSSLKGGEEN